MRYALWTARAWRATAFALCSLIVLFAAEGAAAHESRPAYLEITQTSPERYSLLWRTPLSAGMPLPVVLALPTEASNITEPTVRDFGDSLVERRLFAAHGGLAGKRVQFVGLEGTITDVLVRVQLLDGTTTTTLVRPASPWVDIEVSRGPLAVAGAYVMHGIEHILLGYDHLLFVLALILIVPNLRMLLFTVTAFTVAHSITLALATLGVIHVPGPPVEASIALSILLLACEIERLRRGEASLTARFPWVVAFSFGLLHGLGFASALSEIGLPRGDVPLALFAFNVGVEAGQLAFIAAVLGVVAIGKRLPIATWLRRAARPATTAAIGIAASFWLVERVSAFWP